jgi:hypothetical protein
MRSLHGATAVALLVVLGNTISPSEALVSPPSCRTSSSSSTSSSIAHPYLHKKVSSKTQLKSDESSSAVPEESLRGGGQQGQQQQGGGTATIPNEVFNLIKSIVGAGVLSLPAGKCFLLAEKSPVCMVCSYIT